MPIGLFMLVALSVFVSRHARQLGRNPGLWVLVLWLCCLGGGYLAGSAALAVSLPLPEEALTVAEARSRIFVPTIVGMVLGAVAVVFAVNRSPYGHAANAAPRAASSA
ncbi:MAG: hypothetical protein MUC88_28370 [Planctomycetes bacterium]|jgi:hypothetical protein|nr:hypothetical protein [Planctomycetota bacterium]